MSKLGLIKAKQAGEPPDKKRKTALKPVVAVIPPLPPETADVWDDDDLDVLLTQDNLDRIDNLIASQQVGGSVIPTGAANQSGLWSPPRFN